MAIRIASFHGAVQHSQSRAVHKHAFVWRQIGDGSLWPPLSRRTFKESLESILTPSFGEIWSLSKWKRSEIVLMFRETGF
jgi:hypothetical protein